MQCSTSLAATSVVLMPDQDAFLSASNATKNYGAAGALSIAGASASGGKGEMQTLMRFDLSAAKSAFDAAYGAGTWTVQSLSLQLTSGSPNNPIFNSPNTPGQFAITWLPDDSWVEGSGTPMAPAASGVTYANQPPSASDQAMGTGSFTGGTSGNLMYALTAAPGFSADLSVGSTASLRFVATDATLAYVFNSRDFPTVASRPQLTIVAAPEPTLGGMVLIVCAGGLLRRRRKASAPHSGIPL